MVEQLTVSIEGMSCGHCKKTLEEGLGKLDGVESVQVDLEGKKAVLQVSSQGIEPTVHQTIEELGYDVAQ